ncbi:hypothetical protein QBC46DRAFT_399063 [Diplogelasinospora grovesii]|uniref:Uncharacterized protein n=1 Tax=Diplogelasinospora grovesii TaxID=303347 RepID=A0AAN6MWF7_9PEZI|nr:hypothetical protein QBC46DRAFT_399063 [Diplogelasinospora grovesii]
MSSITKASAMEPSPVTLTGPENWRTWLAIVRKFANDKQIWDHINPLVPEEELVKLTAPKPPNPVDFLSKTARDTYNEALRAANDPDTPSAQRPLTPLTPTFASIS